MDKVLKIGQILVYYDFPHVFTAKDEVGTDFLCLLVNLDESDLLFLSTAISKDRLIKFLNGSVELREIFQSPEVKQFFQFNEIEDLIQANEYDLDVLPDEFLPESGFKFQTIKDRDEIIISESIEYQNAIIHLAISDEEDNYSIEADDLGDIVKLYQVIIENTYKKELNNRKSKDKKFFYQPQNYKLRAFASSHSSFNIHLYSTSYRDLFGSAIIELGLEKFTDLIRDFNDEDIYIDILRGVKGHSISTFKKLIKKIIDDKLTLKHKWYAPNQESVHLSVISPERAGKIYEILNSSEELSEEIKDFSGYFSQVDVDKGTWRLHDSEVDEELNGESSKEKLQGITVETKRYQITCIEIIEAMKVSEKEKIKYILKEIKEV